MADQEVVPISTELDCDFVFSGLSADVAGEIEGQLAEAGYPVISNARNYRMREDVPLLIPEINPEHTALIERQPGAQRAALSSRTRTARRWGLCARSIRWSKRSASSRCT